MTERALIHITAIVPFPEGDTDEVLVLPVDGGASLPIGALRTGERMLDAAVRVVREQSGFNPIPGRILYLLESAAGGLTVGILCSLPPDVEDAENLTGEFVSLSRFDERLEPFALREILLEDVRSGFVRPVAHIVETRGANGVEVLVSW